jgi:hypothetical protein
MKEMVQELWVSYKAGQNFEGDMLKLTNYAAALATLLETVRDAADGRCAETSWCSCAEATAARAAARAAVGPCRAAQHAQLRCCTGQCSYDVNNQTPRPPEPLTPDPHCRAALQASGAAAQGVPGGPVAGGGVQGAEPLLLCGAADRAATQPPSATQPGPAWARLLWPYSGGCLALAAAGAVWRLQVRAGVGQAAGGLATSSSMLCE